MFGSNITQLMRPEGKGRLAITPGLGVKGRKRSKSFDKEDTTKSPIGERFAIKPIEVVKVTEEIKVEPPIKPKIEEVK